jgi:hypothetical protein
MCVKVRNIPRSSILYAKRAYNWKFNSGQFLSGDVFADAADLSVYPPKFRGIQPNSRQVSESQVIFCPSHKAEEFFFEYKGKINAKVLIFGNSDRDFLEPLLNVPDSVKTIFCQNLIFEDSRYQILPIGIENTRLATNGLLKLFSDDLVRIPKIDKILIGPISMTHPERSEVVDTHYTNEFIVRKSDRMSPEDYSHFSSTFRFIGAPRGNGIDTHRFWETLYRGGIPIVKKTTWSKHLINLGYPLHEVNSWQESDLIHALGRFEGNFDPKPLPQLWWPWWNERISSFI